MKALSLIFIWAILGITVLKAQNPASTQSTTATISGSYFTSNAVDVYALKKNNASQTDPTLQIDRSIYFKLKKGDKFYVNSILNKGGATLGYMISVWNYNEKGYSEGNDDKGKPILKEAFYKNLLSAKLGQADTFVKLKDSIKGLETTKDKIKDDSLELNTLQTTVISKKELYDDATRQLLVASLKLLKTELPEADRGRQDVTSFFVAQSNLKEKMLNLVGDDKELKDILINKALALPVSSPLDQKKKQYLTAQTNYNNSKTQTAEKKDIIAREFSVLKSLRDYVTNMLATIRGQKSTGVTFKNPYKILKPRIGEYPITPDDPASPYAPFADLAFLDSWANEWQFFMNADDFAANCVAIHPSTESFTWGFLTLPLKLRFDNDKGGRYNFEQNLNFGLTFGGKHQFVSKNDISFNYLAGISVVNVPLNNAIPGATASDATSTAGFSFSVGGMFQVDKFQIGLYLGKDFAGEQAKNFAYQGKTWLGIAIGISLFGEGKATAGGQSQD